MSAITTHVLDVSRGEPAAGISVRLLRRDEGGWEEIGSGATDPDGRVGDLLAAEHPLQGGEYRLELATGAYFESRRQEAFYPEIQVTFRIEATDEHYHVPVLLSPFGYSTYRGS